MTNKHTPGPWRSDVQGSDGDQVFSANGMIVADCKWTAEVFDKRVANAALIASAPDLLAERDRLASINAELVAALEDASFLLAKIGKFPGALPQFMGSIIRSVQDARAALAAAKGE